MTDYAFDGDHSREIVNIAALKSADERKLQVWLRSSSPTMILVTITPDMAVAMLALSREGHRKTNLKRVREYCRALREGTFLVMNQTLGFDTNQQLTDGTHRLTACVQTGVPLKIFCCFGMIPKVFAITDRGGVRTPGQLFGIAGHANGNLIAAAVRLCYLYDYDSISLAGGMGLSSKIGKIILTPDDLLAWAEKNPSIGGMLDNRKMYHAFRPVEMSALLGVHWLIRRQYGELADEFMHRFCYGEDLKIGTTIWNLRARLISPKEGKVSMPKSWKIAFIIKAFNAFLTGRTVKQFKILEGEPFPRIR